MISSGKVIAGSFLRSIFVILVILIALDGGDSKQWFFEADWFKITNLVLFSISNGYISTQCTIWAPQFVEEEQREQVGFLNGSFIGLGILIGSIIAIPAGAPLPNHWATA